MSPRGPRTRIGRGLYEDRSGIDAFVQVKGQKAHERFSKRTLGRTRAIEEARIWRSKTESQLRRKAKAAPRGPFLDDCKRYLKAVQSMPTYGERVLHLDEWCRVFGHRRRDSLSASEIRAQLEAWKAEHGWTASTLNHRRTALQHLFTVLDGKSGENPVRDVPRFREPDAKPRGVDWPIYRRLLRVMPPSVTRLRLALIYWTGLPHATLGRITRADLDLEHRTLARPGRKKGAGTRVQLVPLTRRAVWYFKLLERCDGFGAFSTSSMRGCFLRAVKRLTKDAAEAGEVLDLAGLRPYDARHAFGSLVYARTHDLEATATMLGHSSLSTTRRYTLSAVPAALTAAVAKVEAKTPENVSPPLDPAKATARKLLTFQGRARSSGG